MIVPLLLIFPLAGLALALALARRLGPAERAVLVLAAALLAASAILSPFAAIHDAWAHYMHLRDVPADPRAILFPWDRPGFVLLAAGPAAFGYRAARLAAIIPAVVALAATMLAARRLGLVRPWAAGLLVLAQYDFFGQGASTMTELPFAAALAIAVLGWAEDLPWLVAAGLGWMGITRPEGPAFVAAGAAAILWRWREIMAPPACVERHEAHDAVAERGHTTTEQRRRACRHVEQRREESAPRRQAACAAVAQCEWVSPSAPPRRRSRPTPSTGSSASLPTTTSAGW